jgi:hypothetical protein
MKPILAFSIRSERWLQKFINNVSTGNNVDIQGLNQICGEFDSRNEQLA